MVLSLQGCGDNSFTGGSGRNAKSSSERNDTVHNGDTPAGADGTKNSAKDGPGAGAGELPGVNLAVFDDCLGDLKGKLEGSGGMAELLAQLEKIKGDKQAMAKLVVEVKPALDQAAVEQDERGRKDAKEDLGLMLQSAQASSDGASASGSASIGTKDGQFCVNAQGSAEVGAASASAASPWGAAGANFGGAKASGSVSACLPNFFGGLASFGCGGGHSGKALLGARALLKSCLVGIVPDIKIGGGSIACALPAFAVGGGLAGGLNASVSGSASVGPSSASASVGDDD